MPTYEHGSTALNIGTDSQSSWFTKTGPTESFLRTAPKHVLQDNRETAPTIKTDPNWFAKVGPTSDFVASR